MPRDETAPFTVLVEGTIRRHAMLAEGDGIVVAVSGGPDSIALLDVLAALAPVWGWRLVVGHVDHGLRPESAGEASWVAGRARALGLPCEVRRVDAAGFAREHGLSPEAAARLLRYRALEELRAETGATRIAVGHHRDDLVETVLLRLLAGAGSDGLAGIPPVRGPVVRPLIERSRAEIEAYLRDRGLAWLEDPSNRDPAFPRNLIRHELLPWLEQRFNPRLRDALARSAALLRDEVAWMDAEARRTLDAATLPDAGERPEVVLRLDARRLEGLPAGLQRRVLRLAWWRVLRGRLEGDGDEEAVAGEVSRHARLSAERVEDLRGLLERGSGGVDLPGGLRVLRRGGSLLWMDLGARVTM